MLFREYKINPIINSSEVNRVIVVPDKIKEDFLHKSHDIPYAGHRGWEKTLERIKRIGYWVGMAADVQNYCKSCDRCMAAKQPLPQKTKLVITPVGYPWQRIAVDVLEVPLNSNGNKYLLVVQDYFTKWLEAHPMPDQNADRIVDVLTKIFCRMGIPKELHSDQGRNFENLSIASLCNFFGVKKTHTSSYHPQGDGLVERSNRILLDMLRSYVDREEDWEQFLPLMLYAYNTSIQSSTKTTPFALIFGRDPGLSFEVSTELGFDPNSYESMLKRKLHRFERIVNDNLKIASENQKRWYDQNATRESRFGVGDKIWLSIPCQSKLHPRWEGGWQVVKVLGLVNLRISHSDGRVRVVHINRTRPRYQREMFDEGDSNSARSIMGDLNHEEVPNVESEYEPIHSSSNNIPPRRSGRQRRVPKHLEDYLLF